jgi:ATP-dependent Lon protease
MTGLTPFDPAAASRVPLPLVPLRDMVVFPRMMAPFVVGRASSIAALEEALASPAKTIFLAAQKDPRVDEPVAGDIHEVGVIAVVVQSLGCPARGSTASCRPRAT